MNCNYVAMSLYFQPFIVPSYICVCIVVLFMYWFVKRNLFTEQTCTDSNTRQKTMMAQTMSKSWCSSSTEYIAIELSGGHDSAQLSVNI